MNGAPPPPPPPFLLFTSDACLLRYSVTFVKFHQRSLSNSYPFDLDQTSKIGSLVFFNPGTRTHFPADDYRFDHHSCWKSGSRSRPQISMNGVTLQAGKPGVVQFHLPISPSDSSQGVPFYTLQFKSKPRPFSNNGKADIEGFKSPSQLSRFTTSVTDLDTSQCVNLVIDNVNTLDEGVYLLTAVWRSFENVRYETIKKEIVVQVPPGPAKCFIHFK